MLTSLIAMFQNAGDGTTCATVLARALVTEGMIKIENGAAGNDVRRGIQKEKNPMCGIVCYQNNISL